MSAIENKAVEDLHEAIMDELRNEALAVQIKVGFGVLVAVLADGARDHPEEVKRTLAELQQIMDLAQ
jgi:hypothetical protein